jgi:hypothetical protein
MFEQYKGEIPKSYFKSASEINLVLTALRDKIDAYAQFLYKADPLYLRQIRAQVSDCIRMTSTVIRREIAPEPTQIARPYFYMWQTAKDPFHETLQSDNLAAAIEAAQSGPDSPTKEKFRELLDLTPKTPRYSESY